MLVSLSMKPGGANCVRGSEQYSARRAWASASASARHSKCLHAVSSVSQLSLLLAILLCSLLTCCDGSCGYFWTSSSGPCCLESIHSYPPHPPLRCWHSPCFKLKWSIYQIEVCSCWPAGYPQHQLWPVPLPPVPVLSWAAWRGRGGRAGACNFLNISMSSIFVCDGDSPRLLGLEKAPPPLTIMSSWLTAPLLRDSSEEKWGLFTNRKLGMSWAALLFLRLLVLFRVSVIVPVILSLQKQTFNKKIN